MGIQLDLYRRAVGVQKLFPEDCRLEKKKILRTANKKKHFFN